MHVCSSSSLLTHNLCTKRSQHKHTMAKRHADSTQDKNPRKRRQLSADEVFVEAAKNGDTTAVRVFLEKFNPYNIKVAFDAAHEACRGNHDECLILLLPYVETTQMGFGTLLSECVHADHVACTEVLLQHWKSVCNNVAFVPHEFKHNTSEEDDCPAMWEDPAVCRILIDAGADLHTTNEKQRSPLHYACGSGALDVVKMLVEAGARARATDEDGDTCLDAAVWKGHTEIVRYLVGLPEVDVNHLSAHNHTALHFAVQLSKTDLVQVLIDAGAEVETRSYQGGTPLYDACASGAPEIVKMLVEAGAGVRATDNEGCTCLHSAAYSGHIDTVRYLVGLPVVELNHKNATNNYTALHLAVVQGEIDVVQVLIDAGADIDTQNDLGRSPLNTACESGSLDIVKMLVRAGATDNGGCTCLMLAAYAGHTETVRYLVGLPEVDVNRQNTANNHTALHYAVVEGSTDVVQILLDAGADFDTQNNLGRSPLHSACDSETPDVVKMLVEAGAGVRATDNEGHTCLIIAACSGHTETVRYLVGLPEVDVNHQDAANNFTALQYAVDEEEMDVVQVLIDAGADENFREG